MLDETAHNLLERMARDLATPAQTVGALIGAGYRLAEARELVFYALGGSDLVEIGKDGAERYHASGRLVDEVERLMAVPPSFV